MIIIITWVIKWRRRKVGVLCYCKIWIFDQGLIMLSISWSRRSIFLPEILRFNLKLRINFRCLGFVVLKCLKVIFFVVFYQPWLLVWREWMRIRRNRVVNGEFIIVRRRLRKCILCWMVTLRVFVRVGVLILMY